MTAEQEVTVRLCFPSLHNHLVEHLNAEIVLQTISDVNMALDWIRSTFLYIRALKNPTHYGVGSNHRYTQNIRSSANLLFLFVKSASTPVSGFSANLDRYGIEAKLQGGP